MKLYYHQFRNGIRNFGDDLNPWLWPQLLPGIFDDDDHSIFVGIGTILNDITLPKTTYKVVFGSGVGYGQLPAIHSSHWSIYCVRGPLTAQALGLSPDLALTDPAVLVRLIGLPIENKIYQLSFMPHVLSVYDWDLKSLCEEIGFHFIDPRSDIETVLHDIQSSKLILCEALHGAIVADALRIPWIPVKAYNILEFKWQDWCQSIGLNYKPACFPPI